MPPPHLTFCCATTLRVHPLPLAFICTGWLLRHILSCCLRLTSSRQHRCLSTCRCITPPIHLLFAPAGCHVASCGTSTSHLLACPPLHLHLLLQLISSTLASCCVLSPCHRHSHFFRCCFWLFNVCAPPLLTPPLSLSLPPPWLLLAAAIADAIAVTATVGFAIVTIDCTAAVAVVIAVTN
jgi:hypothetical protein